MSEGSAGTSRETSGAGLAYPTPSSLECCSSAERLSPTPTLLETAHAMFSLYMRGFVLRSPGYLSVCLPPSHGKPWTQSEVPTGPQLVRLSKHLTGFGESENFTLNFRRVSGSSFPP